MPQVPPHRAPRRQDCAWARRPRNVRCCVPPKPRRPRTSPGPCRRPAPRFAMRKRRPPKKRQRRKNPRAIPRSPPIHRKSPSNAPTPSFTVFSLLHLHRDSVTAVPRPNDPVITPALVAEHGLTPDEYDRLVQMLGRTPTFTELGVVSALWSEHCSYKHSRPVLKTLPTKAPWVLQGPGENAGVISVGDGVAVAFKIESHNHPSAVEPYQGAATGVGGILR